MGERKMHINSLSNSSFGTLYNSIGLEDTLASSSNVSQLKKELSLTRNIIKQNGLHRKKNVDLILNYNDGEGFYTVISSKKYGVPVNPNYRHPVSPSVDLVQSLINWVDGWDYAYSSESIREHNKFLKNIRKIRKLLK